MQTDPDSKHVSELLEKRYGIIGNSKPMNDAVNLLLQVAPTDLTVLITGETGTGKEVFANAVHGLSLRKNSPFISVNCGAIPESLLESELFGHERGAFTGAIGQRKGFFEVADEGTIFLDEIGEMPIGTQVKLLRVLESGEFTRLGSTNLKKVDVRIVAATNRDLAEQVRIGDFRQDLFFRLVNVHIILPPLREHIEDISVLVDYFAKRIAIKLSLDYEGISRDVMGFLMSLPWNGNVRELKNLVETVITLEKTTSLTPDIFQKYITRALPPHDTSSLPVESSLVHLPPQDEIGNFELGLIFKTLLELKNDLSDMKRGMHIMLNDLAEIKSKLRKDGFGNHDFGKVEEVQPEGENRPEEDLLSLEKMERKLIEAAIKRFDGNRRLAAETLGISERTLYRKLTDYGIG